MKSVVGHIQINIDAKNLPFYKDLMDFTGWSVLYDGPNMLGVEDENGTSLWFSAPCTQVNNDYDGPGMNHLALGVKTQADVDTVVSYLQEHNVEALFDTPRHRPEFCSDPEKTYYQVMFESPDGILFEVVYIGSLSA